MTKENNKDIEELEQCVERIQRHQVALGLSDREFVDRYRGYLGSEKTWRNRLCEGNYADMRLQPRLEKLKAMIASIDGGSRISGIYEDMPVYEGFLKRYRLLQGNQTDRRCMVMLAETGCGKSIASRAIYQDNPREVVYVRCRPTWKNRQLRIVNGIARGLGLPDGGVADEVLDRIIENLKAQPRTLMIDEAHDGGLTLLKLVKCLVDETPSRFVIMAFPTLWNELIRSSSGAWSEARQLYGRTLKPIYDDYQHGTTVADIACMLRHSLGLNGHSKDVAAEIVDIVRGNGNLRLLADVVNVCDTLHEEAGTEIDGKKVIELCRVYATKKKGGLS